jgi:asparagine synthase (glutamine-hydrolysing)
MCGLIGTFASPGSSLILPLRPLLHRGPDAQGSWSSPDGRCWLGHTRLAIQDLSEAGSQPITSHCGRITLVFNGEIYNHLHVRQSLALQAWRGHSDSETLVEGLAQRGLAILSEFHGMFALAAYDTEVQHLYLARDRLGIKPLYYSWTDGVLRFASERRALPAGHRLDRQTITQLLAFGHDRTPVHSPAPEHSGVESLPVGMAVTINTHSQRESQRFWPSQHAADWSALPVRSHRKASASLRQKLEESVAQHLLGDVPVACFLSSGLDSGILAALACRLHPGGIESFTVALPGFPFDESVQARRMADYCGARHHELVIREDQALHWVEQGLTSLDGPTADALNTFLISRAVAAQGIKVALSGLGADELFGGYPSHRFMPWLHALRWLPRPLRLPLLYAVVPRVTRKLEGLPQWDRWHLGLALRRWASGSDLVAAGVEPLQWPKPPPQPIPQPWCQISWAELFGYTEPMLLRDSDVMSMACGLEIRVPFLDHRIVEFALRLPQHFQKPGKGLLREACADLFPPSYLHRSKQGFLLPMESWMRGPLRPLCVHRIQALADHGWLDPGWISAQWQAFQAGQLPWPRAWSLVVLGEFAQREKTT